MIPATVHGASLRVIPAFQRRSTELRSVSLARKGKEEGGPLAKEGDQDLVEGGRRHASKVAWLQPKTMLQCGVKGDLMAYRGRRSRGATCCQRRDKVCPYVGDDGRGSQGPYLAS